MVDDPSGVDIGQRFQSEAMPLFFLFYPGAQRLLDDPAAGPLQLFRQLVDLFGKGEWNVGGENLSIHTRPL
jgi:hypothetical protein